MWQQSMILYNCHQSSLEMMAILIGTSHCQYTKTDASLAAYLWVSPYPFNKYALTLQRLKPSPTDKCLTFEKNIKTKERQTFKLSCPVCHGPHGIRDRLPYVKVKTQMQNRFVNPTGGKGLVLVLSFSYSFSVSFRFRSRFRFRFRLRFKFRFSFSLSFRINFSF